MASSSPSGLPPLQPGRKRRAHKRSRNGCSTCKQRHIRCDEVKPICTACLTRGGECGYPEPAGSAASSALTADAGAGSSLRGAALAAESASHRLSAVPSSPADPFDCLPIEMPHRSLQLFNHFATHRIFSRTAVPKNPDSECVSFAFSNPETFRASLLSTALNYSWLSGGLKNSDMEETFIYHKLEAIRIVNAQIADPILRTSDGCLSLIAALGLVESGMGNYVAAEAHLKGLFTLIDSNTPQNWQHRLYGLLQRVIVVTGSYIASAKRLGGVDEQLQTPENELNKYDRQTNYTRIPSSIFAASPVPATSLSPFYFGVGAPIIEACKADIEGLILINALRRLSSMPVIEPQSPAHSSRGNSLNRGDSRSPRPGTRAASVVDPIGSYQLSDQGTVVLLADTDAYTASLLFKPHHIFHNNRFRQARSTSRSISPAARSSPFHAATSREASGTPPPPASFTSLSSSPQRRTDPYEALPPALFPSASRAWATAAYLYLHIVLSFVWENTEAACSGTATPPPAAPSNLQKYHEQLAQQQRQQLRKTSPTHSRTTTPPLPTKPQKPDAEPHIIGGVLLDPQLLRLLLDTLCADIQNTEEAMRIGSYSRELWLWKVVVGAYCVEVLRKSRLGRDKQGGATLGKQKSEEPRPASRPASQERHFWGWIIDNDEDQGQGTPGSDGDAEGEMEVDDLREEEGNVQRPEGASEEEAYMAHLGAWFGARLRSWSRAAQVSNWAAARQMLDRIVWPAARFDGENMAEGLWWRAVGDGGTRGDMARPIVVEQVPVDPRLM